MPYGKKETKLILNSRKQIQFDFDTFDVVLVAVDQIQSSIIQHLIVDGYSLLLNEYCWLRKKNKYLM